MYFILDKLDSFPIWWLAVVFNGARGKRNLWLGKEKWFQT